MTQVSRRSDGQMILALFDLFLPVQGAIHVPDGAKILAFFQKGPIDLLGA